MTLLYGIGANTLRMEASNKHGDDDMRNLKGSTGLFLALLLALTTLLAACGSTPSSATPTPVKGEFVEELNLGGFALSTDGQQVIAYLCDGTVAHLSVAEWFKGTVTKNRIDITNAHGSHLVAALTPQAVTGTIILKDGHSSSLTAYIVPNSGKAFGLYRSEQTINGVQYLGGWINGQPTQASSPVGVQAFLAEALVPYVTCCIPTEHGGIINEGTGALIKSPPPDFPNPQVTVANLGTFRLTQCQLGTC